MHDHHGPRTLVDEIAGITGESPLLCYQCGKCSAGCPVRAYMGTAPNQVVRLVQLGLFDRALASPTIWLCAGCLTCTSRCPKSFDLARFMDAMRELALAAGVRPPEKDVAKFHKAFLAQVRRHGRAFELGLMRDYKLASGHLFQDIGVAPTAVFKGKIRMLPHNVKNRDAVRRIFEKAAARRVPVQGPSRAAAADGDAGGPSE